MITLRIPSHIGIIPDGNRRWAQNNGFDKQDGYSKGIDPGFQVLKLAMDYGVNELTYYGFTTDNLKRPPNQVEAFVQACIDAVEAIAGENVSLLVLGNTKSRHFPKELLKYTQKRTNIGMGGMRVNFLVNYGWEWDMSEISTNTTNRSTIQAGLMSRDVSRIDMIIRWGGRRRLSGFLPVQSVYADFYVVDKYWPDFEPGDFHDAIKWYNTQDITLGG